MQILDYLGALFLALVIVAIAALLSGRPWYSLYFASGAVVTLLAAAFTIVVMAAMYDDEDLLDDSGKQ